MSQFKQTGLSDGHGTVVTDPPRYLDNVRREQLEQLEKDILVAEIKARRAMNNWTAAEHIFQFANGFFSTFTPSYSLTLGALRCAGYISPYEYNTLTKMTVAQGAGGLLGIGLGAWLTGRAGPTTKHFMWRVDKARFARPLVERGPAVLQIVIPGRAPIVFLQSKILTFLKRLVAQGYAAGFFVSNACAPQ